ncbi:hypothetical protein CHS0354_015730 [Potamilus streckersoni]|uniref:Uncharacterized protein n=1 Tax=Potamilus streckersoni TaxID=2493646 RepID=A0AAE0TJV5_9BIVA|nr:hypothetical protein CHS0354_015730 [Potamilus streckersoni]
MSWIKDVREEFCLKNFGLTHDRPSLFSKLQCGTSLAQTIWLLLWTLYFLVLTVVDFTVYNANMGARWLVYLSNWDYILIPVTSGWDLSCTVYIACKRKDIIKDECKDMTWYTRIEWVLYNVINTAAIFVTILFWTLLPPNNQYSSINKHVINMVFVVTNMCIMAKPIRLLHFYQPMSFCFIYVIFSIIFQKSGGGAIYEPLNWDIPEKTSWFVVVLLLIGVPFIHSICFLIFKLRQLISRKWCNPKSTQVTNSAHEPREMADKTNEQAIVTTSRDITIQ